ncbi:MAG TPA: DUF4166 domain-containing protein [Candidatus Binatia bacterium]|jgi:hypothetical protein
MSPDASWLYPLLLRDEWAALPAGLQAAHFTGRRIRLRGSLNVKVENTWLARIFRKIFGLPATGGTAPATLEITGGPERELWSRKIGAWKLSSLQSARDGRLRERAGLLEFEFRIIRDGQRLCYTQQKVWMHLLGLSLPLPRFLAPQVSAVESAAQAPFCSEIAVCLRAPGGRLLVAYAGKLRREGQTT